MNFPDDPVILLSVVNTMLRDKYSSFEELCNDCQIDGREITDKLSTIGYLYNEKQNQFK